MVADFWKHLFGSRENETGQVNQDGEKKVRGGFLSFIGKKKSPQPAPPSENVQTAPLTEDQLQGVSVTFKSYQPTQVAVGCAQSVGMVRDHNEDALFIFNSIFADGGEDLPMGLFMVADGMGGHQHGEVASSSAIRSVAEVILNRMFLPSLVQSSENRSEPLQELIESAVREAQYSVTRRAPGGGTTLTAAILLGDKITIAQIGDSRAYFIHLDGRIQAVTQDHSLVRRLVELGQLTEEEAAVHPQRNVLYRAIGQAEPYRPDINTYQVPRPGFLLICSDGLWGLVSELDLFRLITNAENPSAAAHKLVEAANANGGPDNISAIVVQFL